jgi:phosphopantothenoylcysteine synthetase/decarboxylase
MNVVVTGGGTIAPIDDVRFIANTSTGSLSARITEACLARGARVWHVHALSAQLPFQRLARFDLDTQAPEEEHRRLDQLRCTWLESRSRLRLLPLRQGTVADYADTLRRVLTDHPVDIAFLAMAASDFEPEPMSGKLSSGLRKLMIYCRPTLKVIRSVREWAPDLFLVGFKLLSGVGQDELIEEARQACRLNASDLTVANDQSTVRERRHVIHLVRLDQPVETYGPDDDIAQRLVDRVWTWRSETRSASAALRSLDTPRIVDQTADTARPVPLAGDAP